MTTGLLDDFPRARRRRSDSPFAAWLRIAAGVFATIGILGVLVGFMRPSIANYFGWEARIEASVEHEAIRKDISELRKDVRETTGKILEAVQARSKK